MKVSRKMRRTRLKKEGGMPGTGFHGDLVTEVSTEEDFRKVAETLTAPGYHFGTSGTGKSQRHKYTGIKALLKVARKVNAQRNALDLMNGFAPPGDGPPDVTLRSAIEALHAGLSQANWSFVAESYAILCDDLHPLLDGGVVYDPSTR